MCEPCTSDALLEAVRGLRVADPELGFKPLLAKLRQQQPDLGAATKEVREVLKALQAGSEAKAAVTPPATDEGGAPPNVALSLACFGCARLPSEMDDDREKHPVCPKCRKLKLLTTYWCCVECPGNPGAWKRHAVLHKEVKATQKRMDGGTGQQRDREAAEWEAVRAAQTGDTYHELLADAARYMSEEDSRRAARAFREAITLKPGEPGPYHNLGAVLSNSGHKVEAAQQFLEARQRYRRRSEGWAVVTANAFEILQLKECDEVAKPEWWNDEGLKTLSARVVRAAPNYDGAHLMRATVLSAGDGSWEAGPRWAADLRKAATHYERAAALCDAPLVKAEHADLADWCRSRAEAG